MSDGLAEALGSLTLREGSDESQAPPIVRQTTKSEVQVGSRVDILYDSDWWPGHVIKELPSGGLKVRFDLDDSELRVEKENLAFELRPR